MTWTAVIPPRGLIILAADLALLALLLMACQRPRKTPAAHRLPRGAWRDQRTAPVPPASGAVLLIPDYECYLGPYPVTLARLEQEEAGEQLAEAIRVARRDGTGGHAVLPPHRLPGDMRTGHGRHASGLPRRRAS
jgi:hypothetical protein